MKSSIIVLNPIINSSKDALSDYVLTKCFFCQKYCHISSHTYDNLYQMSRNKRFFCGFCIRNGLNTKKNKDILILTFKNVFNQFYHQNHLSLKKMWVCEIRDFIKLHKKVGMENPVFSYDEDSMNWFVDFAKVGDSQGKMPLIEVEKTVSFIIESLKMEILLPDIKKDVLKQKYLDAISLFYNKRYRPKGKAILSPSVGENRKGTKLF